MLLLIAINLPAFLFLGPSAIDHSGKSLLLQKFLSHLTSATAPAMGNNGSIFVFQEGFRHMYRGSFTIPRHIDAMRANARTGHRRYGRGRLIFSCRVAQIYDDQAIPGFVHERLQLFGRRHSGGRWVVVII
jgi:hypothetical protein